MAYFSISIHLCIAIPNGKITKMCHLTMSHSKPMDKEIFEIESPSITRYKTISNITTPL